jgi:aminopeptidase N
LILAACVIRMFLHALTPEVFNKGLHSYLTKQTTGDDGVADPAALYAALQSALPQNSEIKVKTFFESWEHQSGFPYLTIERNYNGNQVKFHQKRFLNTIGDFEPFIWHIPITYVTESNGNLKNGELFWSNSAIWEKSIDGLRPNNFIVVNIDQKGYYRVLYDNANWMLIANFLNKENFNLLSPNTRAMLIDDSYVFAGRGDISLEIFLEIIKYLERDADWIPWFTATDNLFYVRRMLDDGSSKLYQDFRVRLNFKLS